MRVLSPRPELETIVPYVPGSVDEDKVILGSNESALVSSLRVGHYAVTMKTLGR